MKKWYRPVAVLAALVVVFLLLGLRVAHPKSGLGSAVGSASTSVVVYKTANSYEVGQRVLADTGSKNLDPATSIVRTVEGNKYDIQAGSILVRVDETQIRGRIVALFPFIGGIFKVFGL